MMRKKALLLGAKTVSTKTVAPGLDESTVEFLRNKDKEDFTKWAGTKKLECES